MEPIPHIDVAEESRIEALLAAPGNHSWPAIDSESMDGWVPDLGLTGYANYSIYRPPAVAAAGITTTVPPPLPRAAPEPEAARPLLPGCPHLRQGRRGVPAGAQPGLRRRGTDRAAAPRQPPPPHRHRPADPVRRPGQVGSVRERRARRVPDRALRPAGGGPGAQRVRAGHRAPARGGRRLRRCRCRDRHRPLPDLPAFGRSPCPSGITPGRRSRSPLRTARRPCTRSHLPACHSTGP